MSWMKNVWNRLFPDETESEIPETNHEPEQRETRIVQKAPFRFPLISDEEKTQFLNRSHHESDMKPEYPMPPAPEKTAAPLPKPDRFSEAGVRHYERPARKPLTEDRPKKPVAGKTLPVNNRTRRFEPTRVPSPVHGYQEPKPAPIKQLLEQKEMKNESSVIHQQPPIIRQQPPVMQGQVAEERIAAQKKSRLQDIAAIENIPVPQDQTLVEQDTPVSEPDNVNAKAVQQPLRTETLDEQPPLAVDTDAKDIVAAQQETVPSAQPDSGNEAPFEPVSKSEPPIELVDQTATVSSLQHTESEVHTEVRELPKPEKEEAVQPKRKKEKIVPFNVLMLKSDKERYKKPQPSVKPSVEAAQKELPPIEADAPKVMRKLEVQTEKMSDVLASVKTSEFDAVEKSGQSEADQLEVEPSPAVESAETFLSYEHPSNDFLRPPENERKDDVWMEEQGERLIEALSHFQVHASILSIVQGPAVTQFEVTVAQGVKVSKIRNLADDLKLALAAKDIRIQAPIPGKSSIGIEIPNRTSRPVRISEVIDSLTFKDSESPLEAALGLDLTGRPVTLDLRKMPHGLIAGATGSGKSVCINSILVSLLYKSSPRDLKLLLIDPKMVELAPYNHIPHLVSPVITDVKAATASLKWAVGEMERRYQLFAHTGVRDLNRYNKLVEEKGDHAQHLPYILIVIDELADLMMMSPSDVEEAICRIAQKARACGIHLVIATQRPSVDVITGLIKSNIPTRIAFSVSSQVDSRTILDSQGAERLLGRGDMLYLGNGMSAPTRIQGTFVTDEEIEQVISHVRSQGEPNYFFKEEELMKLGESPEYQDDLFEEACRFIMHQGSASTSLLQRKFHIGYNRAARLMDLIEQHGFISEQNGSKARSVLITEDDMSEVFQ